MLRDSESCGACGGGCMSGPLMSCQVCDKAMRHWHCFAHAEEGAWMCDACCKVPVFFTLLAINGSSTLVIPHFPLKWLDYKIFIY